jgi:hypothetical protein
MTTTARVTGHTLRFEGAAYDDHGRRITGGTTAGTGRGRCSCGTLSEVLDSANQRRAWHRQHKAEQVVAS